MTLASYREKHHAQRLQTLTIVHDHQLLWPRLSQQCGWQISRQVRHIHRNDQHWPVCRNARQQRCLNARQWSLITGSQIRYNPMSLTCIQIEMAIGADHYMALWMCQFTNQSLHEILPCCTQQAFVCAAQATALPATQDNQDYRSGKACCAFSIIRIEPRPSTRTCGHHGQNGLPGNLPVWP